MEHGPQHKGTLIQRFFYAPTGGWTAWALLLLGVIILGLELRSWSSPPAMISPWFLGWGLAEVLPKTWIRTAGWVRIAGYVITIGMLLIWLVMWVAFGVQLGGDPIGFTWGLSFLGKGSEERLASF